MGGANITEIIVAVGTLVTAATAGFIGWLNYNQHSHNQEADFKQKKKEMEIEQAAAVRSDAIGMIYGTLYRLLIDLKAVRVYIIQPHPLIKRHYLSISLEVKEDGVTAMKPRIQNMPMSDVAFLSEQMATEDFVHYRNVSEIPDNMARALLSSYGCEAAMMKRLSDCKHDWVGTIVCEFPQPTEITEQRAKSLLAKAADRTQYIIPEHR